MAEKSGWLGFVTVGLLGFVVSCFFFLMAGVGVGGRAEALFAAGLDEPGFKALFGDFGGGLEAFPLDGVVGVEVDLVEVDLADGADGDLDRLPGDLGDFGALGVPLLDGGVLAGGAFLAVAGGAFRSGGDTSSSPSLKEVFLLNLRGEAERRLMWSLGGEVVSVGTSSVDDFSVELSVSSVRSMDSMSMLPEEGCSKKEAMVGVLGEDRGDGGSEDALGEALVEALDEALVALAGGLESEVLSMREGGMMAGRIFMEFYTVERTGIEGWRSCEG